MSDLLPGDADLRVCRHGASDVTSLHTLSVTLLGK